MPSSRTPAPLRYGCRSSSLVRRYGEPSRCPSGLARTPGGALGLVTDGESGLLALALARLPLSLDLGLDEVLDERGVHLHAAQPEDLRGGRAALEVGGHQLRADLGLGTEGPPLALVLGEDGADHVRVHADPHVELQADRPQDAGVLVEVAVARELDLLQLLDELREVRAELLAAVAAVAHVGVGS